MMDESKSTFTVLAGVVIIGALIAANLWLGYKTFVAGPGEKSGGGFGPHEITAFVFGPPAGGEKVDWQEPRTILILGQTGRGYLAPELTDTVMLLYLDPRPEAPVAKLISIPRDLYVSLNNTATKINAVWIRHGQEISKLVETITGLAVNNLVVFRLETVKGVVDEIGGVSVNIPKDVYDPNFPAAGGGYEVYEIRAGVRYIDGEEAVKLVRTRASAGGDFDRIQRQQELFKAIKGKVASLNPLWNFETLWSIFSIVREGITTDLTLEDARDLWQIGKNIPFDTIYVMSIDIPSDLVKEQTINSAYVLVPTIGLADYSKIREAVARFIEEQ